MKKVWGSKTFLSAILLTAVLGTSVISESNLIFPAQTVHAATESTKKEKDKDKLDKPVISNLDNAYNGVVVTWNEVKDAEGYLIYRRRKSTEGWTLMKKVLAGKKRKFVDKDAMKEMGLYTYMIKAYKGDIASEDSETKTITRITITRATVNIEYRQKTAREMLKYINDLRTGSENWAWNSANNTKVYVPDLSRFAYDYALEKCAMIRAAEIAVNFTHERPNGKSCFTVLNEKNYIFSSAGENIARGYKTAKEAFTAFAEANRQYEGQEQRRVMLSADYNVCAIGHVVFNDVDYWVQLFAKTTDDSDYTMSNNRKTKVTLEIASEDIPNYDKTLKKMDVKYKDYSPGKGKILSIERARSKVTLNLQSATGAQGYEIYRSTKKKSGYKRIKRLTGKLSYNDKKVLKNKKYYYYVVPFRIAHDTYIYGKKSAVVMVKTRK
nr:CAP domain-containing protein [Butyrivibrio sp.]